MRIVILGDEWAVGEWTTGKIDYFTKKFVKDNQLIGKGIEKYFPDTVSFNNQASVNFNLDATLKIINSLHPYPVKHDRVTGKANYHTLYKDNNTGYLFKTEQDAHDYFVNKKTLARFIPYLDNKFVILWFQPVLDNLDEVYSALNGTGYDIYCIGSTGKLDLTLLSKYENLIPLIECVVEFLDDVDYFSPTGKYPNAAAYEKIAQYIKQQIPFIN